MGRGLRTTSWKCEGHGARFHFNDFPRVKNASLELRIESLASSNLGDRRYGWKGFGWPSKSKLLLSSEIKHL